MKWEKTYTKGGLELLHLGEPYTVVQVATKKGWFWRSFFSGFWLGDFRGMTQAKVACEKHFERHN